MIQAVARAEPGLGNAALALIDGLPPAWNVVALNEAAIQAGIEPGMTKSQAAQFCGVEIRRRSRAQESIVHAALLNLAWSFSPRVEDTAPDTLILDLAGLASLFGTEENIATQLKERASSFGLAIHVAISTNLGAALHAARGFPGITFIPPGEESQRLGSLPVSVLLPPAEILETFERWGIRTCSSLAALPVLELSERLGQQGIRLHEWACGASLRSLVLAEPAVHFEEQMELEDAVAELEPLSFLLGRLLDQLCARLVASSLAACAIRLRFDMEVSDGNELSGRDTYGREVGSRRYSQQDPAKTTSHEHPSKIFETVLALPVPVQDSKLLLKLIRLQLQSNPPASAIVKISLAADPAAPRVLQKGLFLPSSPDPEKLELMLARLAHVVGHQNIGAPQLMDTHRPGEFRMCRFAPIGDTAAGRSESRRKSAALSAVVERRMRQPAAGFRMLRPSPPARVDMREGRPVRVSFQGRRGDVVAASGPWRTSGDWWREDAWQQDEWELEIQFTNSTEFASASGPGGYKQMSLGGAPVNSKAISSLGIYRFYYDSIGRKWFVRGVYD